MLILTNHYNFLIKIIKTAILPRRAIPKRKNLGWAPSSCASAAFRWSPVQFVEMLVSLWLTSGADRITASSDSREPRTGLSPGSLLCAPTFSTCQDAGGECVFIFRSSGGPHDPVRHRAHAQARARTYSFTSVRTRGGLGISATRTHAHTGRSCASPHCLKAARRPSCVHLSVRASPSVQLPSYRGVLWCGAQGLSDVPPLVSPVSSLIVHRLHPLTKLIRSRVPGPSAGTRLILSLLAHLLFN